MKRITGWILALLAPSVLWSAYLFMSRLDRTFSATTDYLALAVSAAVGAAGVWMLTGSHRSRPLLLALYLVFTIAGMYWGRTLTVCSAGDCP